MAKNSKPIRGRGNPSPLLVNSKTKPIPTGKSTVAAKNYDSSSYSEQYTDLYNSPSILIKDNQRDSTIYQNVFGTYKWLPNKNISWPDEMLGLYLNSPTASGNVKKLTKFATGDGFYIANEDDISQSTLDWWKFQLEEVNADGDNLEMVIQKNFKNHVALGNGYLELVEWNGELLVYDHQVREVRVKNNQNLRAEIYGINYVWELNTEASREIPAYPLWSEPDGQGARRSMIHVRNIEPGQYIYGLPNWIEAKYWLELEYRIAKFNVSRLRNGLTLSSIVQFFDATADDTEAEEMLQLFVDKYTGAENEFQLFTQVLTDKEMAANVIPMTQEMPEGGFMNLLDNVRQQISAAQMMPLGLAGLPQAGKLGDNQQIQQEFQMYDEVVIKPLQRLYKTRVLNILKKEYARIYKNQEIRKMDVELATVTPVNMLSDAPLSTALSVNQMLEIMNMEASEHPDANTPIALLKNETNFVPSEDETKENV